MANAASTRIEGLTPGDGCVHSDGKLFNLTPRILDLDFAYLSSLPIWNLAKPVMQSLALQVHVQVQESCSAAVLDSYDIVCVLRVSTHKIVNISLGTGSHFPVYCTSMGRMLLSVLADDALRMQLTSYVEPALP